MLPCGFVLLLVLKVSFYHRDREKLPIFISTSHRRDSLLCTHEKLKETLFYSVFPDDRGHATEINLSVHACLAEQYHDIDLCSWIWISVMHCDIQMKQMPPEMSRTVNKDNPTAAKSLQNKTRLPQFTLKAQGVILLHPLFQYVGLACIWDELKVALRVTTSVGEMELENGGIHW